ncbi:IQ domain-containing protein E [Hypomesus transpacificus]|uniref:IQ domain-containing protein E n=1 Tax=Hypomesus transpacificus TaxID=137520 RepID=UPI001F084E34|nr:IQ domain-containing protein E [Hypomesus transpacificus]
MMSLEARDVQTDEDFEDVVEDVLSLTTYMSDTEKKAVKRRISNKPPSSPRSPYLSSLSLTPRRSSLPPRGSLRGEVGEARRGALSSRHTWLNGQGSECDGAPENTKLKKHQPPRSASNGVPEHRDKEDMYDEILHLKKSLQTQKLDKEKMKARLQRLEEVKTKREKQIEELLDPTKGSEYTRSLVDSKSGGSTVVRGLKQQILRLEQQSREKEDTLTTLQSELRTTSMAEMKITMEIYYEEIQRLRVLLENAERSSRVESKGSQRQNRVLSSRVVCLSEKLQQLQQENLSLREELSTDTPVGGARGYREWSKQRLLRRLVEQEKRLEEGRRPTPSTRRSQSDQAIQTDLPITTTEGEVSRVTAPQEGEELVLLRGRILQLEKEKEELQERLTNREHLFSSQIQPKKENPEEPKERKEEEREEERWMEEQREGERRMEEERVATTMDSDDSDDIIVSPSRPLRRREELLT